MDSDDEREDNDYMQIAADETALKIKKQKRGEDEGGGDMLMDLANRVIDVSSASNSVWLVKVPSFLADTFKNSPPNAVLGKINIGQEQGNSKTPAVSIHMDNSSDTPKNYNLKFISNPSGNTLVFNEDAEGNALKISGTVQYECHATPIIDDHYLNIMRTRREVAERPKRTTQLVEAKGNVQGVKKVSNSFLASTSLAVPNTKKRKAEDFKRDRLPREEIIEIVFRAFEKQQYWSLKEMVELTNQPIAYMKEILAEVAVYISRGPYKSKYQLKPEFKK